MLDFAWPELVVIGAVALVAIGPKDLPKAMYTLGKWAGKARSFAHDLHRAFEQVTYEAEVAQRMKGEKENPPSEKPFSEKPTPPHE
jgi:sec-independent protein translocase protein TatB